MHCPLSGPDLNYISLLIIPCIIYHVTNKETLNLEPNRALTISGAESGLNGCKEAVIPAFPLHFFILMFVITLFLYINVCNVH